jgi:hypothetical protein
MAMAQEPIEFYKEMLALLERGTAGNVEKVKENLRRRIKLAEEQKAKTRPKASRVTKGTDE